jgi:DNA-binding LacI/PurR family transcriptional regulator
VAGSAQRTRHATIFDVAKLAGVSHQTVSRVLNGHPNVREATREKVREAVAQLRYRPNLAARAMVNRRSRNLGLLTTGSPDYGPSSTVSGFTRAARTAKYSVTISTAVDAEPASLQASLDLLLGQQVEAVVLVLSRMEILRGLQGVEFETPVVAVEPSGLSPWPSISIDHYGGARLAIDHLIELGHREILHLAGPSNSMDATERSRGWRDTMSEHGLVAHPPVTGDWSPSSGYLGGRELLSRHPGATAVFSANDQMAVGCLHALRESGRSVPEDVSVVGFDDVPEAEHLEPPLTTMRQDFFQLGEDIMELVLATLSDAPAAPPVRHVPELIVRASTRRR